MCHRPLAIAGSLFVLLLCLALSGCGVGRPSRCIRDSQCRYDRVCYAGQCVAENEVPQDASGGSDANTTPDTYYRDVQSDPDPRDHGGTDVYDQGRDAARDFGVDSTGEPRIRVSPNPLDFGEIPPGMELFESVSVTNTGTADLHVFSVSVSGEGFFVTELAFTLSPDSSRSVRVSAMLPADLPPGTVSRGQLTFSSDAVNTSDQTIQVQATAAGGDEEACLRFEDVPEQITMMWLTEATSELMLVNCGTTVLIIDHLNYYANEGNVTVDVNWDVFLLEPGEGAAVGLSLFAVEPDSDTVVIEAFYAAEGSSVGTSIGTTIPVFVLDEECPAAELYAQVDRDGPEGLGPIELELGHQVELWIHGPFQYSFDEFELTRAPDGSMGIVEAMGERDLIFVPDVPGLYTLDATFRSADGCVAEDDIELTVTLPENAFVAWVVWEEPDPQMVLNDLDFYVARLTDDGYLWQTDGFFVGPAQITANFGDSATNLDDPRFGEDYNTEGFGPEMIVIPFQSTTERIAIGVHAFSVSGTVQPRIRIYLGRTPRFEATIELSSGQFWLAAETLGWSVVGEYDLITDGFPSADLP